MIHAKTLNLWLRAGLVRLVRATPYANALPMVVEFELTHAGRVFLERKDFCNARKSQPTRRKKRAS